MATNLTNLVTANTGSGVALNAVAADLVNGNEFVNDGNTRVKVDNPAGGGGAATVVIDSKEACSQGSDHNGGGSVPAGEHRWYGPFPKKRWNDGTTQKVTITVTGGNTPTIALLN